MSNLPVVAPFNLNLGVETMLQCGGSCAGCVLSSMERTTPASFDTWAIARRLEFVRAWLDARLAQGGECESITVFFGPGDHFLLPDEDLKALVRLAALTIPDRLKARTTCFVSASAVGKTPAILAKTEMLYHEAQRHGLPFFVQTVFDPQKYLHKPRFAPIYLDNIQGFRERFGMTEIAINLSGDVPQAMSPDVFHAWMQQEGFRHVEFAWLPTGRNVASMRSSAGTVVEWLLNVVRHALTEPAYEINLVPLLARAMLERGTPLNSTGPREGLSEHELVAVMQDQIYVDAQGGAQPALAGVVGNQLPVHPRGQDGGVSADQPFDPNIWQRMLHHTARAILRTFLARRPCAGCAWKSLCARHGAFQAIGVASAEGLLGPSNCPFDFNGLLDGLRELFDAQPAWPSTTRFDRNPVPWALNDRPDAPVPTASSGYFHQRFPVA